MKLFNHFVITRFNLKQSIWYTDKQGGNVNNQAWLDERYDLFERFCYPSMLLQEEQDFKWLVYFDYETPEFYKKKNEQLKIEFPNFIPRYVEDFKAFEKSLQSDIQNLIDINRPYLITTRLDNDDCFHEQTVKIIQKNFVKQHMSIIDLQNGMTLQVGKSNKLALRHNVISGPFISLIEQFKTDEKLLTVYDREHTGWSADANFVNVNEGYYWLQIIHNRNISNKLGNELTFNKKYLKGYSFIKNINFSFRYYLFIVVRKSSIFKVLKLK